MNNCSFTGRLTRPVQIKKFNNGTIYTRFTLACDRHYKNKNGHYDADFINCFVTGEPAEYLYTHTTKGSMLALQGPITTNHGKDRNGQLRYYWYVNAKHVEFIPVTRGHYVKNDLNKAN